MREPAVRSVLAQAVACLLVTACATTANPSPSGMSGRLVVSAAASLTDAFAVMEAAFEDDHPDVDVVLNLGSSSGLREQILSGAPADVFASANAANMEEVVEAGIAEAPAIFATNRLQIAVPAGNPAGVTGLADFARPELLIGLCAEGVPCGDFARQTLEKAGVTPSIDTNEPDVRALLTRIEAGELDAGIVYVTDVRSTDGVDGIDIADDVNVVAEYPIAALTEAPNPVAAAAFVAFVRSDAGRTILERYGFVSP